jgi:hypothetical protein
LEVGQALHEARPRWCVPCTQSATERSSPRHERLLADGSQLATPVWARAPLRIPGRPRAQAIEHVVPSVQLPVLHRPELLPQFATHSCAAAPRTEDCATEGVCRSHAAHEPPSLNLLCHRDLAPRAQSSARLRLRPLSALRSWALSASLSSSSSFRSTTSSLAAARYARQARGDARDIGLPITSELRLCTDRPV